MINHPASSSSNPKQELDCDNITTTRPSESQVNLISSSKGSLISRPKTFFSQNSLPYYKPSPLGQEIAKHIENMRLNSFQQFRFLAKFLDYCSQFVAEDGRLRMEGPRYISTDFDQMIAYYVDQLVLSEKDQDRFLAGFHDYLRTYLQQMEQAKTEASLINTRCSF